MKISTVIFASIIFFYMFIPFAEQQEDAKILYEKAQHKLRSGDPKEAAEIFNGLRSINESFTDAWYGEGLSYLKMGRYEESYEIAKQILRDSALDAITLEKFATLAGDSSTAYERSRGVPLVGKGEGNSGPVPEGYIQGMKYYDEAIKLNPNSTIAWNRKGIALAELGNYTGSISCFEKVIEINSSQAEAYNNKGASLDNLGDHAQALECYDNATKLDPRLAEAWYNMAKTQALDLNSFSKAKESYSKAIELNPDLEGEQLNWIYARMEETII